MPLVGISQTSLTPCRGIELTGWGYYIQRYWRQVHDDLQATALVIDDGHKTIVLLALDLMVIDSKFTERTRQRIHAATGIAHDAILLTCSHSHNAPAAGGLLGVGECSPVYEDWASRQAATAAILAWHNRSPAKLTTSRTRLTGQTFNRTRPDGEVDDSVTTLMAVTPQGQPLAFVVNFGAHPTVTTDWRPFDVSRDLPGEVCDLIEQQLPGVTCLYVQGACGDVNFLRDYVDETRHKEPAQLLARAALASQREGIPMQSDVVACCSKIARLPTRRWLPEEIYQDREEARRRLETGDVSNWRQTIGRSMTNRPDDMVARHGGDEVKAVLAMARFHREWTDRILRDLQTRPEYLETEVQTLRIGDLYMTANSSEFFSPFALDVRRRANVPELMIACYSNGRIGYLPDAHDIEAKSYAGYQSPKYCDQFPFTPQSGPAMCEAMLQTIETCRNAGLSATGA